MNTLVELKNTCDDFAVEFEVIPAVNLNDNIDEQKRKIIEGELSIDEQLEVNQQALDQLNTEIEKLTNSADGIDYMVAVASGVISGIMDIVYVGEFSLEYANTWGNEKINDFVIRVAQQQGYQGNDLADAVKYLEASYPIAADKVTSVFGGGKQHHLRDFSHHPTLVGLFFSCLTQFTNTVYGTDTAGLFQAVKLSQEDLVLVGNNFHEKITFGVINWVFHMVSDMAGSSSSIHIGSYGTGLPGPLLSLLKEMSVLPVFRNMNDQGYKTFSVWISKLFNGTMLGKRDEAGKLIPLKFDLRTEIGVFAQLGKQAVPVIMNECIVRGFYFVRRLWTELKGITQLSEIKYVNWENTIPAKNRTIVRMLTISTGTMTAIDLADAAIESAVKTGGVSPAFLAEMIVKVNFVGVGRFALAVGSDVKMGVQRSKLRNQRIVAMNERIFLLNGKTFYKQAEMWIAAENAQETIEEAYAMMEKTAKVYSVAYADIKSSLRQIRGYSEGIRKHNQGLLDNINDILTWGI